MKAMPGVGFESREFQILGGIVVVFVFLVDRAGIFGILYKMRLFFLYVLN